MRVWSRLPSFAGLAVLAATGCLSDPLEGSGHSAEDGTRVELMLVPMDEGAVVSEGAEAFDAQMPTTESLDDLSRGRGAFVVGVSDGWGLALVPSGLTDEARDATEGALADPTDSTRQDPPVDDPGAVPSCAADCAVWCSSELDLCDGNGFDLCDCSDSSVADDPSPDCAADCDEWCASSLDLCSGDGFSICDCASPDPADPELQDCTWDCDEWCTTSLDLCDGDGFDLCADSCDWNESRALPPSASGGGWFVPIVVAGVALVIVLTDPEVQQALDRGESIGSAVGGVYGRRADTIMERLRGVRAETGRITDDARLPCDQLLQRRGYQERLDAQASDTIRVGICTQDRLTVWPRDITVHSGSRDATYFAFQNLGSGFRTVLSRDAVASWTEAGEAHQQNVPEGGDAGSMVSLRNGSFALTIEVPRDATSTRVSVNVAP